MIFYLNNMPRGLFGGDDDDDEEPIDDDEEEDMETKDDDDDEQPQPFLDELANQVVEDNRDALEELDLIGEDEEETNGPVDKF